MARTNHFGAMAAAAGTLVAVGLVMLIMVVVEARPAEATFPGNNGRIAFGKVGALDSHIFTIDPDGSGLEKISTRLLGDSDPAWSPDGKKIAISGSTFTGLLRCDADIYVVNANGSSLKRITESQASDRSPSWSPDGEEIAFVRAGRKSGLYTIRVAGTGLKRLIGSKIFAQEPDCRPTVRR
jgi:TolB protein